MNLMPYFAGASVTPVPVCIRMLKTKGKPAEEPVTAKDIAEISRIDLADLQSVRSPRGLFISTKS